MAKPRSVWQACPDGTFTIRACLLATCHRVTPSTHTLSHHLYLYSSRLAFLIGGNGIDKGLRDGGTQFTAEVIGCGCFPLAMVTPVKVLCPEARGTFGGCS